MMKKLSLLIAMGLLLSNGVLMAQKVNTKNSTVEWLGKKIGGEHTGNISIKSGNLVIKKDKISSGEFTIDMTTITCTDLEDAGYNEKLVGHLKSDDFFGVDKHPTANFTLKESSKFKNNKATLTGEITIKGKTETISFDVMKDNKEYTAKIEIDRSKFDIRYGSNSFFDNLGDKAIDDIFTLSVKLVTE